MSKHTLIADKFAPTAATQLPDNIIDDAITWAVKLDYSVATIKMQRDFERWQQSDPLHAIAWERVGLLKQPFASVPSALARSALTTADAQREQQGSITRRNAMKLLSLAGVALGAGWLVRDYTPWQRLVADASTRVGEQKTLRLTDDSMVILNTDSAVSADLIGARRLVMLRRGEMLVTTGTDSNTATKRPFWVYTPFGKLQALGTRFTVRLFEQRARVSVQEGAVELHPAGGAASYIVRAGEHRWLADNDTAPADLQGFDADDWRDGVISGKDIRLAQLLAEIARYRPGHIHCDERVAELRISGLFHVDNTDQALQFLAQTQPISITSRTRFWVSVAPRQDS